jgi:hypothetical protein
MFEPLFSLLTIASMTLAAFALGRPLLRGLGVGQDDGLSIGVWSIVLGFILAGLILAAFGLTGLLYAPLISVLTLGAAFYGLGELLFGAGRLPVSGHAAAGEALSEPAGPSDTAPWMPPPVWLVRSLLGVAAAAAAGSLIGALAPPVAGDALCYHLELPKTFLAAHRIQFLPYDDNSTFPLLAEMWYLWGLAIDGGVAAQLVHWEMGILLALAAVLLASPIIGRRWAWMAGAVVLATPGINNQMTAPLNDVALATLTTLALVAWWQPVVNDENRRWFVLAGMAAGGALATKLVALLLFAVVALVWLWMILRQPARRSLLLQGAAVVCVIAASVSGVWYVRAAWYRGNPIYPFLAQSFDRLHGGLPAPPAPHGPAATPETLLVTKTPLGRGPVNLIASPWQVTMHPDRFGGRAHQLGALLLAAVPGIFWTRRLRGLGILVILAGGYWILWYALRQNVRFLFPVVPLLSVVVVWVWIELRRLPAWPQRVAVAAFAALLAIPTAAALLRAKDRMSVALGLQSRADYLLLHEPTYAAAEVANQVLSANARILSQDYRGFYFHEPFVREIVYRRYTQYDRRITRPGEFSLCLRRAGFTHVLLAETQSRSGGGYDPTLSRLADAQAAADPGALLPLADYRFCDSDGTQRRYRLLMLR